MNSICMYITHRDSIDIALCPIYEGWLISFGFTIERSDSHVAGIYFLCRGKTRWVGWVLKGHNHGEATATTEKGMHGHEDTSGSVMNDHLAKWSWCAETPKELCYFHKPYCSSCSLYCQAKNLSINPHILHGKLLSYCRSFHLHQL